MDAQKTYHDCSGCGLCALVCPVWPQNMSIDLVPWGRAKAVQGGAEFTDIQDSLEACLSCGACEPICPERIPILEEDAFYKNPTFQNPKLSVSLQKQSPLLFKIERYLQKFSKRNEIISDSANYLKSLSVRSHKAHGLGEWLIKNKLIGNKLQKNDLYWMDAALFHRNYEQSVLDYDRLQKSTGCTFNWNLQRTAMPLGKDTKFFDRKKQYEWVTMNKEIHRIVVENTEEWLWLKEHAKEPVVHVIELLGDI